MVMRIDFVMLFSAGFSVVLLIAWPLWDIRELDILIAGLKGKKRKILIILENMNYLGLNRILKMNGLIVLNLKFIIKISEHFTI
jgi:hypothetical protein